MERAAHTSDAHGADGGDVVLAADGVRKSFGEVTAVDGVGFEVRAGEILGLLGPSGCGKTTMLRLIAGLERLDEGSIRVGGELLSSPGVHIPPDRRRIAMVFQDYALFPHLDVAGNVEYALGRRPDRARAREVLDLVGLGSEGSRPVHELSGGQQQRVALARALAGKPRLILLDEPFSNLDASLRARLRDEVSQILRTQGATALFVTHDQEEALSLADRVALMCDGRIEQVDTPEGLYGRPASRWAAGFLGEVEVLSGEAEDGRASCELGSVSARAGLSGPVDILIRPESLAVGIQPPAGTSQRGVVVARRFYGHDQLIEVELESGRRLRSRRLGHQSWHTGDRVHVWIEGPVDVLPPDRPGRRPGRATQAEDAVPGPS